MSSSTFAGSKRSRGSNVIRRTVNPVALQQSYVLYERSPIIRMCRNALAQDIFQDELLFMRGDAVATITPEMKIASTEFWVPFAERCMHQIFTAGVVVCDVEKHHTQPGVPVVVPPEAYSLYVCMEGTTKWFEATTLALGGTTRRNLVVLSDFGSDPDSHGNLTSRMSCLYPTQAWIQKLCDLALKAEEGRSAPTLVAQQRPGPRAEVEGVHYDAYANADLVSARAEDRYSRDAEAIAQLKHQRDVYMHMHAEDQAEGEAKRAMPSVYTLPTDQEQARGLMPEARSDLVLLRKSAEEEICAVMGVPRNLLMSDMSSRAAAADHSRKTFDTTACWWKKQLSRILSQMYQTIYGDADARAVLGRAADKGKTLRDIMQENVVSVRFPSQVSASLEDLQLLYSHNIIDWKVFASTCLRVCGMDPSIAHTKDPEGANSKRRREGGCEW